MDVKKVAILTAGGLAPCLSAALGGLIKRYSETNPEIEIICYKNGYQGLLLGDSITITPEIREKADILLKHGGSPIGNSRVKLTNLEDCIERGLVKKGQKPLQVAAEQLVADKVDVLHTIGGDDTNLTAADLASYLTENNYDLTVVGLPKTIDNDVYPIQQSLGAWTAAEEGARYFENVVAEHGANPRMLIVHEVMGRNCGWLTAFTAKEYHQRLQKIDFVPSLGLSRKQKDVHGIYIPEIAFDVDAEAARLNKVMDDIDCVNLFVAEGAGVDTIIKNMKSEGKQIPRDAFGHVKLDAINPGKWFAETFASKIKAEKVLVQKSGYYSRAAAANAADLELIGKCVEKAVECALTHQGGVIGEDEDKGGELRANEFTRLGGGKPFDVDQEWFNELLEEIGQPKGSKPKPTE